MATPVTKRTTPVPTRNWIAYLCEALITSGEMPTWEAATYLTENLFGEKPNPRLLMPSQPYEAVAQFLQRLYRPLAEAAVQDHGGSTTDRVHVFTDISLTGRSAVLVVALSASDAPQRLLLFDAVKAWDVVFADAESFNVWADARYRTILKGLQNVDAPLTRYELAVGS